MATPVLVATVGGSTSNSYTTLVEADVYAENQAWGDTWLALATAVSEASLINATKWLETLAFLGTRCTPSVDDAAKAQALAWPRSDLKSDGVAATCAFVPSNVKAAQFELAYRISQDPDGIIGGTGGSAAGTYVSMQKLGDLQVEYKQYTGTDVSSCDNCNDPIIINKYPWLKNLLKGYLAPMGSSRALLHVRS